MAQLLDLAEIPAKKSPQLPDQEKTEGVLLTAARSFAYMGVQEPVNGLGQLVGKVSGQDVLPHIQFIAPVKQSEFGSANWHAEQVGAGLGIAMDFLILKKGMGKAALASRGLVGTQSLKFVSAALPRSIAGNPMAMHTVSSIGAGLAFEGVFRPVDESKGSFIGQRIKHAVEGGVTFGMLSAGSGLVKHLGSNRLGPGVIRNLLKSDITSNAIAGAPAGITRAQLSGVLDNGRPAGVGETLETAYAYTLVGGLMGGLNVGGRKAS
ncbi:MAG: hypothetical protein K8F91_03855, partial [Candidatus Obscuribacterales bacterium]|nr:hypothetical protein [Candidatus Obscuribacterales bacterium]